MKKTITFLFILAFGISIITGCGGSSSDLKPKPKELFKENFESFSDGEDFPTDIASWVTFIGTGASNRGKVASRINETNWLHFFTINECLYRGGSSLNWTDYSYSIRFINTINYEDFRLLFRYQPGPKYYEIYFDIIDNSFKLSKNINNTVTNLQTKSMMYSLNAIHTLKVTLKGSNIKVYFDGTLTLEATDTDIAYGSIGWYCGMGGKFYIDNLLVTSN